MGDVDREDVVYQAMDVYRADGMETRSLSTTHFSLGTILHSDCIVD